MQNNTRKQILSPPPLCVRVCARVCLRMYVRVYTCFFDYRSAITLRHKSFVNKMTHFALHNIYRPTFCTTRHEMKWNTNTSYWYDTKCVLIVWNTCVIFAWHEMCHIRMTRNLSCHTHSVWYHTFFTQFGITHCTWHEMCRATFSTTRNEMCHISMTPRAARKACWNKAGVEPVH